MNQNPKSKIQNPGDIVGNLVVFNGGLMRGQSAHWKLKGATYIEVVYTAPRYRLYSIGDRYPAMLREDAQGVTIGAELYFVPDEIWPYIDNIEPPGLYRGPVELTDGRVLEGMLGEERYVTRHGVDISHYGSWADYPLRSSGIRVDKDPAVLAFDLFVNGTLMRGLKLHENLKHAPFLGETRTEERYRIHSIGDVHPGMYRLADDEDGGIGVPGELYRVSEELWPELEASEPPNLYRGRVLLEDASEVWGILYPRELAEGRHPDITEYGGWRGYIGLEVRG
jgi:gamma-glutamylcyclotransferase (GGCT)/AIG2-like uncharacterized protein YtfP